MIVKVLLIAIEELLKIPGIFNKAKETLDIYADTTNTNLIASPVYHYFETDRSYC